MFLTGSAHQINSRVVHSCSCYGTMLCSSWGLHGREVKGQQCSHRSSRRRNVQHVGCRLLFLAVAFLRSLGVHDILHIWWPLTMLCFLQMPCNTWLATILHWNQIDVYPIENLFEKCWPTLEAGSEAQASSWGNTYGSTLGLTDQRFLWPCSKGIMNSDWSCM